VTFIAGIKCSINNIGCCKETQFTRCSCSLTFQLENHIIFVLLFILRLDGFAFAYSVYLITRVASHVKIYDGICILVILYQPNPFKYSSELLEDIF